MHPYGRTSEEIKNHQEGRISLPSITGLQETMGWLRQPRDPVKKLPFTMNLSRLLVFISTTYMQVKHWFKLFASVSIFII